MFKLLVVLGVGVTVAVYTTAPTFVRVPLGVAAAIVAAAALSKRPLLDLLEGPKLAKHYTPVSKRKSSESMLAAIRHGTRAFGVDISGGPIATLSYAPEAHAAGYAYFYETMLQTDGPLSRLTREIIAQGVSDANGCAFCSGAHKAVADSIQGRTIQNTQASYDFGKGAREGAARLDTYLAPLTDKERSHSISVVLQFAFVNRLVDNFVLGPHEAVPTAFLKGLLDKVMSKVVGGLALKAQKHSHAAGDAATRFLRGSPSAAVPQWAADAVELLQFMPHAQRAWIDLVVNIVAVGEGVLSAAARDAILQNVSQWNGEGTVGGVSPVAWARRIAASVVADSEQDKLQLALLTALRCEVIRGGVDQTLTAGVVTKHGDAEATKVVMFASVVASCRVATLLKQRWFTVRDGALQLRVA